MKTFPYWFDAAAPGPVHKLDHDLEVDVLIIGGGITGVSAAYLLSGEGKRVALVERESLGRRDTGHTTAHLTYMTDTRLKDLISTFSRKEACTAWEAGRAAMNQISQIVRSHEIDCNLRTVPGFLVAAENAEEEQERSNLEEEAEIAAQLGFDAVFMEAAPVTNRPGIRFEAQMEFHPLKYLRAIARIAEERGARIFEESEVTDFPDDFSATVNGCTVSFQKVIIATHVPLQGRAGVLGAALFQSKLALYSSYAVRATWAADISLPDLIWSDTADPFLYLRIHHDEKGANGIFGGEDHKTGQETNTEECFRTLEQKLEAMLPGAQITHRWSGQVVETVDGLPFIGPTSETQFIATGFSGNGMTFGTAAAMMGCDWVTGRTNEWSELFSPSRKSPSATFAYLRENKDYAVRMVKDRLRVEEGDPEGLAAGEANVFESGGKRVAASRDNHGILHVCSAVCPHLGCIVAWNPAEQTWDCPCHGSRFERDGTVIAGPAEEDLEKVR